MRKIIFISIFALLTGAAVQAQTSSYGYAGPEGKKMALGEVLGQVLTKKSAERARLIRDEAKRNALLQSHKAQQSLRALEKAYPEYITLIMEVARDHDSLVQFAAREKQGGEGFYHLLALKMEFLYYGFEQLRQADKEVAAQAEKMINHSYWLEPEQAAMTLSEAQKGIARFFTVKLPGGGKCRSFHFEGQKWFQTMR